MRKVLSILGAIVIIFVLMSCKPLDNNLNKVGSSEVKYNNDLGGEVSNQVTSFSTQTWVKCLSNEDGTYVQEIQESYVLNEGINIVKVVYGCSVNKVSSWDNIKVKVYLLNNGNPIPFSINDSKKFLICNEIEYTTNETWEMNVRFRYEDVIYDSGNINVVLYYNPDFSASETKFSPGSVGIHGINYTCDKISNDNICEISDISEFYFNIPYEYQDNATVFKIGKANLYTEDYHAETSLNNTIEVDQGESLYIYWNNASVYSEKLYLGLFVDGNLYKLCEETYIPIVNVPDKSKTMIYPLDFVTSFEKGKYEMELFYMDEYTGYYPGNRQTIIIK